MYNELFDFDAGYRTAGNAIICGVDEAGRGPLAGPVCAAAVILPEDSNIEGLNDSKKLSEKKREALYKVIVRKAISYCVAFASNEEIDEINILNATYLAMNRAIEGLSVVPDLALIDGNMNKGIKVNSVAIIKGDGISASIAAASILAKVTRDRLMVNLAEKYPDYAFEKHKGYGTKLHYQCIRKYGLCDIHRRTFLKGII